jgi:type II secretory pathway pseudopilin PulG
MLLSIVTPTWSAYMDRNENRERESEQRDEREQERERNREHELHADERSSERDRKDNINPPRTTTGKMTSPKFGSATSGGGEIEPGPESD